MPKFFCDVNVNKLAKWLRFAGFDTMTRQELSKAKIDVLCIKERRVFITRNQNIKNFQASIEELSSENVQEQLEYILSKYKIDKDLIGSRCIECNVFLKEVSVIPNHLLFYANIEDVKYCSRCGKYFWKGSHYEKMYKRIQLFNV